MKEWKAQAWRAMALLLVCVLPAVVGAAPTPGQVYEHPSRKYTITLPADARLRQPGGSVDIAIDSDKGYGVILQSTNIGPGMTISEMAATLEATYLGPDKPWKRKVRQQVALISGMVAFNGHYEGDGARYRVVITRGPVNSYTFIFRARTEFFDKLEPEFGWILQNFHPAPADAPPTPVVPDKARKAAQGTEGATPTERRFAERRLGYAVDYDPDWILERPSPEAIMLSGPEGTDAFYATVSIQNVSPPKAETAVQAASMLMDQVRAQIDKQLKDVAFERQGPYVYKKDDVFLLGQEIALSYTQDGQTYRQWSLVIPRPDGKVAYLWSYRAPAKAFARYQPKAEAILRSWSIIKHDETASQP